MEATTPKVFDSKRKKDRRGAQVEFDRRCFDRRDRAFLFNKTVFLSDTNAFGNTYFAKYFEWQGMARESFFERFLVPMQYQEAFIKSGIKMITVEAEHKYLAETRFTDRIEIRLKLGKVRRASAELLFVFTNRRNGKIVGKGRQIVTFANAHGKLIPLPDIIRANVKPFLKT